MNNTSQPIPSADQDAPVTLHANPSPQPWQERGEQHRLEEWETSRRLLAAAQVLLRRCVVLDSKPSLADVTRMLELASKLGRLATGLATEKTEISGQGGGPLRVEFRAMLDKVYGQPLPSEIPQPDVKALPAPTSSGDSTSTLKSDLTSDL